MVVAAARVWLFWDVEPEAIDLQRDRRYVLGRVLERGRLDDVRWAVRTDGLDGVRLLSPASEVPGIPAAPPAPD